MTGEEKQRPIIIRRKKVTRASHSSGAWKVAYADFVTAMMAFFLLMWLLSITTQDQRLRIPAQRDRRFRLIVTAHSGRT